MKVLEQPANNNDNTEKKAKQENGEKKPKRINFTSYRNKKNRSKSIFKLVIVFAIALIFVLVWYNAAAIFEPLRGIASKIENKTSYDVGFPVNLPGSTEYSFKDSGEIFSLLTDTYLYTYKTTGEQIYALKHGYSKPEQITSDKRILLFDKSAYSFALYSKTSLIYNKVLDDKIIYANIGSGDMAAIVTDSSRYSNVLYVYDGGGNWKYTKKFADENVMQVSFIDNTYIIVSTISVDSGEIVTNYYKFSIKSTEGPIWSYSFKGNSLPCGLYADGSYVVSVCDNIVVTLDSNNGSYINSFSYKGVLKHFDISSDYCTVQYNESSTNKNNLVVLNKKCEAVASATVTSNTQKIINDTDAVYILDGIHLKKLDTGSGEESDAALFNEDYTDFIKIDSDIMLLGYDTVNKISLGI